MPKLDKAPTILERTLDALVKLMEKEDPSNYVWLDYLPIRSSKTPTIYIDINLKLKGVEYTLRFKRYFYPTTVTDTLSIIMDGRACTIPSGRDGGKSKLLKLYRETFVPDLNRRKYHNLMETSLGVVG